jgi:hypothetical protein
MRRRSRILGLLPPTCAAGQPDDRIVTGVGVAVRLAFEGCVSGLARGEHVGVTVGESGGELRAGARAGIEL